MSISYYRGRIPRYPCNPGDWFSPRRRLYVERLCGFLWWNGALRHWLRLDGYRYSELNDHEGMDRYAVDRAVDDAYTLGVVDMRLCAGDVVSLLLLSDDVDGAPVDIPPLRGPAPHAPPPGRNGRHQRDVRERGRA